MGPHATPGRATRRPWRATVEADTSPESFPVLLTALDYASDRNKEVAIAGDPGSPATRTLLAAIRTGFNPNLVVAVGLPGADAVPLLRDKPLRNDRPTAYVCEGQVGRSPTHEPRLAADLAQVYRPLKP